MERPQTFANIWLILQTVGFIIALDGVAEYFSDRHYHNLFRRFLLLFVSRDPNEPKLPDDWGEWFNS